MPHFHGVAQMQQMQIHHIFNHFFNVGVALTASNEVAQTDVAEIAFAVRLSSFAVNVVAVHFVGEIRPQKYDM